MVNGSMILDAVAFLKEKKGEEAVKSLEEESGNLLFDQYRMYPLEKLLEIQKEVVTKIYGSETDGGYKALGEYTYKAYTNSVVGATLTNVATTPNELLAKIQELWNTVVNFGERKLIKANETTKQATIQINDDPRPIPYLLGVIEAGLSGIGVKPQTKISQTKNDSYQIEISWK